MSLVSFSDSGAEIVKTLVKQGNQVIINYYQSKELAEHLVKELGEETVIAIQADVRKREEVDGLVEQVTKHFGQIDVVINNALVDFKVDPNAQKPFAELSWEGYEKQLNGKNHQLYLSLKHTI